MTDDPIDWFEEADGFSGGTRAPHKWVLQAHSEIIRLRARVKALVAAADAYVEAADPVAGTEQISQEEWDEYCAATDALRARLAELQDEARADNRTP